MTSPMEMPPRNNGKILKLLLNPFKKDFCRKTVLITNRSG